MASLIAHPFVALAIAPFLRQRGMTVGLAALGAACTVVPDVDVIGLRFGVQYASLFGHRGFTHSLFFALGLAALLALALRSAFPRATPSTIFTFLFLCTASHGALDALTDGGLGVAFFSPFSNYRFFFPWRPIVVSPLSVARFMSGQARAVLASELQWVMLPSLVLAAIGWFVSRQVASRRT